MMYTRRRSVGLLVSGALLCTLQFPHVNSQSSIASGPIEIVFSFDTTGSMSSVIRQVRTYIVEMVQRLQSDIPGIRIAIFAHGDYGDSYVTKFIDFTTDVKALQNFVKNTGATGGGDAEEAYELALHEIRTKLSWTQGSTKSVMIIGDERPHEPSYRRNKKKINWETEAKEMKKQDIKIYAIQALGREQSDYFYKGMANLTDGYRLQLDDFSNVFDFIMAISYREYGLEFLEAYEREVKKRPGGISTELQKLFNDLRSKPFIKKAVAIPTPAIAATETPEVQNVEEDLELKPEIYFLHVTSDISYRFATTTVESKLANKASEAREAIFNVQLPQAAFIANFTMIIDGVEYPGEVKEKEAAKRKYNAAKKKGKTAGHVAAKPRNTNSFKVGINVESGKKITFKLIYQELLQRKLGFYEHPIYVNPGQPVRDFKVNVNIRESRKIKDVMLELNNLDGEKTNFILEKDPLEYSVIERPATNVALVSLSPSYKEQTEKSVNGIKGQYLIKYDVVRELDGGEIKVNNGYFVHYFAPSNLPPVNKNIVFVLDTSGSMSGDKLRQLQEAMDVILSDMREGDFFNIIGFSSFTFEWKEGMIPVNNETIAEAKDWVQRRKAAGGTNINAALELGINSLSSLKVSKASKLTPIIFFLTDGEPTSGTRNKPTILTNINSLNQGRFSIFSLGFGNDVDFPFLKKTSLQNKGVARRIYADSDAALQLQGFFQEVATPLMKNVQFDYIDVDEESLTDTEFDNYFKGSELVVAGKLKNTIPRVSAKVSGEGSQNDFSWTPVAEDSRVFDEDAASSRGLGDFTERMWAYLTIKKILDRSVESTNATEKAALKKRALEMSLKYHFVTPLTSMVAVKPDEPEETGSEDNPDEKEPDIKTASKDSTAHAGGRSLSSDKSLLDSPLKASRHPSRGGGRGFADHDPHFVVKVSGSNLPICFDIMGEPGQIYQLLHDPKSGVTVNTRLVGDINHVPGGKKKLKTYFGDISVISEGFEAIVSPHGIVINQEKFDWKLSRQMIFGVIAVHVNRKKNVTITFGDGLELLIVRHMKANPLKENYLGFYITNGQALSEASHGLLGQFEKLTGLEVEFKEYEPLSPILKFTNYDDDRDSVRAYPGKRRSSLDNAKIPCWFVKNNGRGLIEGKHTDYIVPRFRYGMLSPGLRKIRRKRSSRNTS